MASKQSESIKSGITREARALALASGALALVEHRGLSVPELGALRSLARSRGARALVIKNTLARIAFQGTGLAVAIPLLQGPLTYVFSPDLEAAQVVAEFSKKAPKLLLVGGALNGSTLDADALREIAAIPARPALLGRLAATLEALAMARRGAQES